MNFIQSRCHVNDDDIAEISHLLATLNSCSRKAFSLSRRQKIKPNDLTELWCRQNNIYTTKNIDLVEDINLTSHQKNMIARNAKNLRNTANARSEYLVGHYKELALACKKAITKKTEQLKSLKLLISLQHKEIKRKELGKTTAALLKKNIGKAAKLQLAINNITARQQRLTSAQETHSLIAKNGLASICFGSRKLASAVHRLNEDSSPYPSKTSWAKTWHEARNQSWLFEGNKTTAGANPSVKWDNVSNTLKIRLTDDQALKRMKDLAIKNKLSLEELLDSNKLSTLRMACRYIEIPLIFKNQNEKLQEFLKALTPNTVKFNNLDPNNSNQNITETLGKDTKPKKVTGTQPCDRPISWRIWLEGDPSKPERCKLYARAQWQNSDAPSLSSSLNGCLGIDINMWGLSTAYCDKNGNKPSIKSKIPLVQDYPMNWTSTAKDKKSSEQIMHEVRVIAKKVVEAAANLGVPIALESLDFSKNKTQLRYETQHKNTKERSQKLSSFAYQKLIESIIAKANKVGVEVRFVDPGWTSVVGWAKYGVRLGLNVDQAAAFTIARRAVVSKGKNIKRAKRNSKWVDLYAKAEKLDDFSNQHVLKTETKDLAIEKISNPLDDAPTPIKRYSQQSMSRTVKKEHLGERKLADILGQDRRSWAVRLKEAAIKCGQTNLANRRRFNLQGVSLPAL